MILRFHLLPQGSFTIISLIPQSTAPLSACSGSTLANELPSVHTQQSTQHSRSSRIDGHRRESPVVLNLRTAVLCKDSKDVFFIPYGIHERPQEGKDVAKKSRSKLSDPPQRNMEPSFPNPPQILKNRK